MKPGELRKFILRGAPGDDWKGDSACRPVLAVELRRKAVGGSDKFVATVYDANTTGERRRIFNRAGLERMSTDPFYVFTDDPARMQGYFGASPHLELAGLRSGKLVD